MAWWAWLLLGLVLLGGEMLTPGGFYLLFFGLGGVVVGLLDLFGIHLPASGQWLLFSLLSITATLVFRRPLLARIQLKTPVARLDDLSGETAMPLAAIPAGGIGKVELRGTVWTARNTASREVAAGERCRVVRADGLTLVLDLE